MSTCSECGAPIRWVVMRRTGKRAPLDDVPSPKGNIALIDVGLAEVLTKAKLAEYEGQLFISHFATCPAAERFRRK